MLISPRILTGQTHDHIASSDDGYLLHEDAIPAFQKLKEKGARDGFRIEIVSGFRDFEAQRKIWNLKATGKRALLDAAGDPLVFEKLSPREIVYAILRWSALPGASRHHWGTDFDVIDGNSMPEGYTAQLIPQEIAPGGVFEKFAAWLGGAIGELGFFRPYAEDRGGVSPEWWHLSYEPLATLYLRAFSQELAEGLIAAAPDFELKEEVLNELPHIYDTYVRNISLPGI